MKRLTGFLSLGVAASLVLAGCAAPAPTPTPPSSPAAPITTPQAENSTPSTTPTPSPENTPPAVSPTLPPETDDSSSVNTTPQNGTIQLLVTDAPPKDNVTSIMVNITSAEIHRATANEEQEQEQEQNQDGEEQEQEQEREQEQDQGETGEWLPLAIIPDASPFDLLVLKESGLAELLATAELPEGKYTQIRLAIDSIQIALDDGELQEAKLPSQELKIIQPFDIVAGETTTLLLDFDADKSVTVTGAGEINFKPVVKLTVS